MSKPYSANDEQLAVLSEGQKNASTESQSHDLVREPSFPRGSIGNGKAWQAKGPFEQPQAAYDYVALQPQTQVWQDITLPVAANPADEGRPDFWLGCEYDTGYLPDCTLKVYDFSEGKEGALLDTRVMEGIKRETSPATGLRPLPESRELNWTTLPLQRIKGLRSGIKAIRIKYEAADGNDYLNLRNTDLDVRLPELKAKLALVVDPDGLKIEQTAAPYKVCHGAKHRLEVSDVQSESWLDQPLALSWHEDRLPIELALQADPPFQRGDVDGDSFLNELSATKTTWTITSSADATTDSVPLSLGLKSWWQAAIGKHDADVGDYVCALGAIDGGDSALVIDDTNANKATLETLVTNHFVSARKIQGAKVEWRANGRVLEAEASNTQGRSICTYEPEEADIGSGNKVTLTATLQSELGAPASQHKELKVFATSPWPGLVDVYLDGNAVDFNALGVHLSRGVKGRKLLLKPKDIADNFFIGKDVTLTAPDNAEKLGISFQPVTAQRMTKDGVEWTLDAGATERGLFELEASTPELNVPFVMKGVQLSADLGDEVQITFTGSVHKAWQVYWQGKAQVISLVPKQDSPLRTLAPITWMSFTQGTLPQDEMGAEPGYEDAKRPMVKDGLNWTLTGKKASGSFKLAFHVEGFELPLGLDHCALLAAVLADEVALTFEQDTSKRPLVFLRDKLRKFSIVPKAGSPLAAMGLEVKLQFLSGTVTSGNMRAEPDFNAGQQLVANGVVWGLTGGKVSGTFGLTLSVDLYPAFELKVGEAVLMSASLTEEADVKIEGATPSGRVVFRHGQGYSVTLVPKATSPLRLVQPVGWSDVNFPSKPERFEETPVSPDGWSWKFDIPAKSQLFDLVLHAKGSEYDGKFELKDCLVLAQSLEQEAELIVDSYFFRNHEGTVRLQLKADSPLAAGGVKTKLEFKQTGELVEDDAKAAPEYGKDEVIPTGGHAWNLTCGDKSGWFSLTCHVEYFDEPLVLAEALVISPQYEDEADVYFNGLPLAWGRVFFRNEGGTLNLQLKPGSPLERVADLTATLSFVEQGASLESSQVPFVPTYGEFQLLTDGGVQWALNRSPQSGIFGFEIKLGNISGALKMNNCLLVSSRLNSEVVIEGGVQARLLRHKGSNTLVVQWSPESPLVERGERLYIIYDSPVNLVSVSPDSVKRIKMTSAGRAEWKVQALESNGAVKLTVMGEMTGVLAEIEYVVMDADMNKVLGIYIGGREYSTSRDKVEVGGLVNFVDRGYLGCDSDWSVSCRVNGLYYAAGNIFGPPLRADFNEGVAAFKVTETAVNAGYDFFLHYKGYLAIPFLDAVRFNRVSDQD
ncbi:hypothetical protein [Pseudomonas sp. CC120222-01a]|uniref:hypothetical protein n=1 Tax=Pseudomonas sp. CC120222-01a TaxID=1378075 RepID=UPI000D96687E|nr:hypothetical protein [Pseudomonas sp. CC120222-01a]PVZ39598.1 hypothetical protein N430_03507 [Pseudomonas sp. CC120222-01a]